MKIFTIFKPLLSFWGLALLITMLSRAILACAFSERLTQVESWWLIFPLGLRTDMILLSYLSIIPAVLILLMPNTMLRYTNKVLCFYCSLFLIAILFMELSTYQFIDEYDTRPNKLFLEYLIYPKEVFSMLLKGRLWSIIFVAGLVIAAIYSAYRWGSNLFYAKPLPYKVRLIFLPVILFLLFWGARGSLTTKRPINASNAIFCNDQMVNSLGLNSTYTVLYAAYQLKNETSSLKMYGRMSEEEAYERVKEYMLVEAASYTNPEIPFLHVEKSGVETERPYNVVIFLQESMGAEFVGCLGGMPLTPKLDALAKEGTLFSSMYCTGTRSVRGIEAVFAGFPPSPAESIVKLSGSQVGFATAATILKQAGYNTSFIYGGMANFDNMASFFNGNGIDNIVDESVFDKERDKYAFKGTWGYSDEDLSVMANNYYKSLGDKPFFSLIFSSSNHEPFEFPDGRIELYEKPKNTVHNAIKYADYAIGKFFELAKEEAYYKNTIFIIIADHNTRTYGRNLLPVDKFRIPALIIGPNVSKDTIYSKLASQIDIMPTVLPLLGIDVEHPMIGRNLFNIPDSIPGRAIMQFHDINGFRVEDQFVVHQPHKEPLQFKVVSDTLLLTMPIDSLLVKDALAHVLTAEYLYKNKKHKLRSK